MLFDTLIDSVSGLYRFTTISIHLANPIRTRHTFPNNQLGELFNTDKIFNVYFCLLVPAGLAKQFLD
jgi:hypothetical protein